MCVTWIVWCVTWLTHMYDTTTCFHECDFACCIHMCDKPLVMCASIHSTTIMREFVSAPPSHHLAIRAVHDSCPCLWHKSFMRVIYFTNMYNGTVCFMSVRSRAAFTCVTCDQVFDEWCIATQKNSKDSHYVWSDTPLIKHLVMREFVGGPPSYRRAVYDSCPCVWHESFMRVTWLLHMCNMTLLHVEHDSRIRVSQLIFMTWLHAARPLQRMPY